MSIEIERKFLLKNDDWERASRVLYIVIDQGYLMQDYEHVLRIRAFGREGWLTIKSTNPGMKRMEYEYPIRYSDALVLLNKCRTRITKERYGIIDKNQQEWTIDVFGGQNRGLVIAEIELNSEDTEIELPEWIGKEVTGDKQYYNADLAENPYTTW